VKKDTSPKKAQREGNFSETLEYYVQRYSECLKERDVFLSGLYLDEVAHCLIAQSFPEAVSRSPERMSAKLLQDKLSVVIELKSLEGHSAEQASLDIHVTLRKRFPESFEKSDPVELEPAE